MQCVHCHWLVRTPVCLFDLLFLVLSLAIFLERENKDNHHSSFMFSMNFILIRESRPDHELRICDDNNIFHHLKETYARISLKNIIYSTFKG